MLRDWYVWGSGVGGVIGICRRQLPDTRRERAVPKRTVLPCRSNNDEQIDYFTAIDKQILVAI